MDKLKNVFVDNLYLLNMNSQFGLRKSKIALLIIKENILEENIMLENFKVQSRKITFFGNS